MAYSQKQKEYTMNYMKENLDEIKFRVPKGQKAAIREHAEKQGEKLTPFIIRAITRTMEQDNSTSEESTKQHLTKVTDLLPPDILNEAQNAAERTGESLLEFCARAVKTQVKLDETAPFTNDENLS